MAEMTLTISVLDKASAVISAVQDKFTAFGGKVKGAIATVAENFTALHFAVTDAVALMMKAFETVEKYVGFLELREQLNLLAGKFGTTADAIVASMKKVTQGQFSIEEATKAAAAALKNSLTPEMILGLAEAAATFNDIAGVSVPEAFNRLAEAVQLGSAKAAQAIVGKEGLGDALDKLGEKATDAERSTALYDAIMAKAAVTSKVLGDAQFTLGDQIDAAKASVADAKMTMDEWVSKGMVAAVGAISLVAAGYQYMAGALVQLEAVKMRFILRNKEEAAILESVASQYFAAADATKKFSTEMFDAIAALSRSPQAVNPAATAIGGLGSAADAAAAGMQKVNGAANTLDGKQVNVTVKTTYIDVRNGEQFGPMSNPMNNDPNASAGGGGVGTIHGPGLTKFGNFGGQYGY